MYNYLCGVSSVVAITLLPGLCGYFASGDSRIRRPSQCLLHTTHTCLLRYCSGGCELDAR